MKKIALILAGWLIDGTGGRTLRDAVLEITDGHILAIRKMLPVDRMRTAIHDYSQCTLLPVLMDSHLSRPFFGESNSMRQFARR